MKQLTLLFLVRNDEVLLAMKKRGFGAGRWNGVGGKLEAGETVEAALIRECQEEIGVTVTEFEQVAEIAFEEHDNGEPKQLQVHVYRGTKWEGEPSESEEMAPQWFKTSELPFATMWPDDEFWLPQVLAGKKLQAQFVLDENDVITSTQVEEVTTL